MTTHRQHYKPSNLR